MEKTIEKKNAELVRRKVRDGLKPFDFKRTKPTFYTRVLEDRIEFIHLHKFTFVPFFRVHVGVRILIDPFDAIALNGFDSDGRKEYNLRYHKMEETVERCGNEILRFIEDEAIPWFEKWRNNGALLNDSTSPLNKELFTQYKLFQDGLRDETTIQLMNQSKRLLGIKG